jgi:glycosyltransferase involved in cell wall biosynthesis
LNGPLVVCSKSGWQPAIRREHALAQLAATQGSAVIFVEQPLDVRALRELPVREWMTRLGGRAGASTDMGLDVVARTTIVPAHRGRVAAGVDQVLLGLCLRRLDVRGATVVATAPWQWDAVVRSPAARRVFDCTDDWSRLLSRRHVAFAGLYRRIGREADAVVASTAGLAELFAPTAASVVRNGTDEGLLASEIEPPTRCRRMTYVGTLSERLDIELLGAVLTALPGWRLDLYGECRYPGRGSRPGAELAQLLAQFAGRSAWHGTVERDALMAALDEAAVLVLPHRRRGAVTGDSMKLYDYAARGRPIVSTRWADGLEANGPPHLELADSPAAFAEAVQRAELEPWSQARDRRDWAEENAWERRWEPWARAVFGT